MEFRGKFSFVAAIAAVAFVPLVNLLTSDASARGNSRPNLLNVKATIDEKPSGTKKDVAALIARVKEVTKKRRFKWDMSIFNVDALQFQGYSVDGYPLVYFTCGEKGSNNSSLILSTVHGDEVTPVHYGFRLIEYLRARPELCKGRHIVVAPFVNPDGFFRYTTGTRTNFNKVDLNRNFGTPEWTEQAHNLWKTRGQSQRRYYPGDKPDTEPETHFQKWMIGEFKPSKIMSVHAPLDIMDYDGPVNAEAEAFSKNYVASCEALKNAVINATPLKFYAYGVFPGSLGNYAGKVHGIPTFTVELPTIDPNDSAFYFGDLEKGTKLFLDFELSGARTKISATSTTKAWAN